MRSLVALAVAAAILLSGCAVTPVVEWQRSTFEGFPGGYGFVSTSSTERTGNRRWNVADPSLSTNPDLARLVRLQAHLVATTPLAPGTPLVGVGMSNGARCNAGYPVKAIWASHCTTAPSVDGAGQLTVPTVFTTAVNDFTVPPGRVIQSFLVALDAGTPAEIYASQERRLSAPPYERIPGVDADESRQIVAAMIATGVWNAHGERIEPDIEAAAAWVQSASLPASVEPQRNEIVNETALQLAVHQFTAEYAEQVISFFNRYVP